MLIFINYALFAQPVEYRPKDVKSYLVNYYSIKGDLFKTKFAYKRFAFLDEATQSEIKLIRRFDKDYLILHYIDFVALHTFYPEFTKMNLKEEAFLHTGDPACLSITYDNGWKFYWLQDRRFDSTYNVSYHLYWSFDSVYNFVPTDTLVRNTELKIFLPKSARWVLLKTVLDDTIELAFSTPQKLIYDENAPKYVPLELISYKITSPKTTTYYSFKYKLISKAIPDSVYIYLDLNKNNVFDANEKIVIKQDLSLISLVDSLPDFQINAGIENYLICFKDGKTYRVPEIGCWTSNVNNRIKNDYYNFYVMDVGSSDWQDNYIEKALNSFQNGYNGIFCDDTWNRIGMWGVDAYPPLNYSDSIWFENAYEFLGKIKRAIGDKILYFNGLYEPRALRFLEQSDGGMTEGLFHNHWAGYEYEAGWIRSCNLGIKCKNAYKKTWVPLSGVWDNSSEPRLYCLASYLLVSYEDSYFGNAPNYQTLAHYPEFDLPVGKPLTSATDSIFELRKADIYGNYYYTREFENCIVYVNPSSDKSIILPELQNKIQIYVDTFSTIDGGRVFSKISDSVLNPRSAKIILKGDEQSLKLCSPSFRNARAVASSVDKDHILIKLSIEANDSSSNRFKSNSQLPLYITADLTKLGILEDIVLKSKNNQPANENFVEYTAEITIPAGANLKNIDIPFCIYSTTGLISVTYCNLSIKDLDTSNYIPNFSFEYDIDEDGMPDFWRKYFKNFEYDTTGLNAQHLKRSVKVENKTDRDTGGVYLRINLNQTEPMPIKISGWSKAENVSGSPNNDYSIYVDFYFNDGTPWYGRTTRFSTGTHDWEYSEAIYYPPKPLASANVYCLFRAHSGTVWFDNIYVGVYDSTTSVSTVDDKIIVKIPSVILYEREALIEIITSEPTFAEISIYNINGILISKLEKQISEGKNCVNIFEKNIFEKQFYLVSAPYIVEVKLNNRKYAKVVLFIR